MHARDKARKQTNARVRVRVRVQHSVFFKGISSSYIEAWIPIQIPKCNKTLVWPIQISCQIVLYGYLSCCIWAGSLIVLTPPVFYYSVVLEVLLAAQSACLGETLLTYRARVSCFRNLGLQVQTNSVSTLKTSFVLDRLQGRNNTVRVRVQLTPIHSTSSFQIKAEQDPSGYMQAAFHALNGLPLMN